MYSVQDAVLRRDLWAGLANLFDLDRIRIRPSNVGGPVPGPALRPYPIKNTKANWFNIRLNRFVYFIGMNSFFSRIVDSSNIGIGTV
jgi:hypothetical protein